VGRDSSGRGSANKPFHLIVNSQPLRSRLLPTGERQRSLKIRGLGLPPVVHYVEEEADMPEISRFYGIVIAMLHREHGPAHFHAKYGDQEITVEVE
jgi:hypothetical protein